MRAEVDTSGRRVIVWVSSSLGHIDSERAWQWALKNCIRDHDQVILATVLPAPVADAIPEQESGAQVDLKSISDMEKQMIDGEAAANAVLQCYVSAADSKRNWTLSTAIIHQTGTIGSSIVQWMSSQSVDECVVGSRGLGAFKGAVLSLVGRGSVSAYLATHSPVSVIVVKA